MKWILRRTGVVWCLLAVAAQAETTKVGAYTYTYRVVDGKAVIYNTDRYGNPSRAIEPRPQGTLSLPSQIGGLPVSIGSYAIERNPGLTSVVIPKGVVSIEALAFWNCDNLVSFSVAPDNPNYMSLDGVLYDKEKKMHELIIGRNTRKRYPYWGICVLCV